MSTVTLSEDALALLRLHLSGQTLHMKGPKPGSLPGRTTGETLTAYRDLVAAGLMHAVSGFAHGPESSFRLSDEGWERRGEWIRTCRVGQPTQSRNPPLGWWVTPRRLG